MGKERKVRQQVARAEVTISLGLENGSKLRKYVHDQIRFSTWMSKKEKRLARKLAGEDIFKVLGYFVDPYDLFDSIPGVYLLASNLSIVGMEETPANDPDFDQLFNHLDDLLSFSPTVAKCLWQSAIVLHDQFQDDLLAHENMLEEGNYGYDGFLPYFTRRMGLEWHRRFSQTFCYLAEDLEAGKLPIPTCRAEEFALHIMIEISKNSDLESGSPDYQPDAWAGIYEDLFQDTDFLMLYHWRFDGIEDSDDELNSRLGIGDMRPEQWFHPFQNATPRYGNVDRRRRLLTDGG